MISNHDAFLLGYLPPMIGIYFNGVELLASVNEGAQGDLAKRVQERFTAFQSRQSGAISNVRLLESVMQKAGLKAGEPPRVPNEFHSWSSAVYNQAHAALQGAEHVHAAACQLLGFILGDATNTLNLEQFVHQFFEASPQHPFLNAQAESLRQSRAKIKRQFEQASALPALPDKTRELVKGAQTAFLSAPEMKSGEHGAQIGQLEAALTKLTEAVSAIEKSLL